MKLMIQCPSKTDRGQLAAADLFSDSQMPASAPWVESVQVNRFGTGDWGRTHGGLPFEGGFKFGVQESVFNGKAIVGC